MQLSPPAQRREPGTARLLHILDKDDPSRIRRSPSLFAPLRGFGYTSPRDGYAAALRGVDELVEENDS